MLKKNPHICLERKKPSRGISGWICIGIKSLSHVRLFETSWTAALQAPLSYTSPWCSDACPLSQWCYLTILFSAAPLYFCLQSFPSLQSFPMNWLHIRWPKYWALATVLPVFTKDLKSVFPKAELRREAPASTPNFEVQQLSSRCLDGPETRVKGSPLGWVSTKIWR